MRQPVEFALGFLAEHVGGEVRGDTGLLIEGVATLQHAAVGAIAFLANSRYRRYLASTQASAVILAEAELRHCPVDAIVVKNPYLAYARIAVLLQSEPETSAVIHPSAVLASGCDVAESVAVGAQVFIDIDAKIGADVTIGPGCIIGRGVTIGAGSRLMANVILCHAVEIGERVLIHPGAVIGSDGFGLANDQGRWVKVPQLGSVVVGDDVEIGANTTVDRGALEDTVISEGAKLDNQVQVAHNVHIGAHTAIAGCVGIAGSTHIGSRCQIGGGVGIVGHLQIVDDVVITAMSLVTGNISKPGLYSSGTPLGPNREWQKSAVRFRQLDDLARRIKRLEKGDEK